MELCITTKIHNQSIFFASSCVTTTTTTTITTTTTTDLLGPVKHPGADGDREAHLVAGPLRVDLKDAAVHHVLHVQLRLGLWVGYVGIVLNKRNVCFDLF